MAAGRPGRHEQEELLAKSGHTLGLRDISLSIDEGSIYVIMGLSGSGKSTLIRHFNRLIEPSAGQILVDGVDVVSLNKRDLETFRQKKMSMVFQRFGLFPHRTVLENAAYGLAVQGVGRAERERRARDWLEQVGLSGFEQQYPHQLSGGMQQRGPGARAGHRRRDPADGRGLFALDPLIRREMQDQLLQLQAKLNKTIVFITHDLDEALRLGNRIAILKDGELVQEGTPEDILLNPANDYVQSFLQDVNRTKVLNATHAVNPARLTLTMRSRPAHALERMRAMNYEYAPVLDGKRLAGVLTAEAALRAGQGRARRVALRRGTGVGARDRGPGRGAGAAGAQRPAGGRDRRGRRVHRHAVAQEGGGAGDAGPVRDGAGGRRRGRAGPAAAGGRRRGPGRPGAARRGCLTPLRRAIRPAFHAARAGATVSRARPWLHP